MKKILILLLSLTMLLTSFGCSKKPQEIGDPEVQNKFAKLTDEWFVEDLGSDILTYHYSVYDGSNYDVEKPEVTLGTIEYDPELDDTTYLDRLSALKEIDVSLLTKEQQISYQTYVDYYTLMQQMYEFKWDYGFQFTPSHGINNNLITNFTEYELRNEEDIKDLITLVKDSGRYIDEAIAYTLAQANDGLVQSDDTIDGIIEQIDLFTSKVEDNEVIKVFQKAAKKLDVADIDKYNDEMADAVINTLIPAYIRIKTALTGLKGKATNDGGLANFEHGKEYYELLMKYYAATNTSVDELEKMMLEAYESTLRDLIYTSLTADQENRVYEPKWNVFKTTDMIEHIKEKMVDDFPAIPEVEYSVTMLDPSVTSEGIVAYYLLSPIDNLNHNVIKANPNYAKNDPEYLAITLAHEGYPGHLFQHVYYYTNHPTQKLRSNTEYLGFTEGWAMYVMQYGYKYFDSEEVVYTMAAKNLYFSYYLSAVADILVNYEGYDVEDLTNFMGKYFVPEYASLYAEEMFYSAVSDPLTFISYGCGLLQMNNLLEKASTKKKFDLKEFNTLILDCGTTNFDILNKEVDAYLSGK